MAQDDRKVVEKKQEVRCKEISKMIGEGGLGAEKYYKIKKDVESERKKDSN